MTDALFIKAKALSRLNRHLEAVEVWDQLVRRVALEASERAQRSLLRALLCKAGDLASLGDNVQAVETVDAYLAVSGSMDPSNTIRRWTVAALQLKVVALGSENLEAMAAANAAIIRGYADADEPFLREQVRTALLRAGLIALLGGRDDEAIHTSRILAQRLQTATDETLLAEAELVNRYVRILTDIAGTARRAIPETLAFGAANALSRLVRGCLGRLAGGGRMAKSLQHASALVQGRLTPSRWERWRRRMRAAMELNDHLISRIGPDPGPELQRLGVVARFQIAQIRGLLGDLPRATREIEAIVESGDAASIQALQSMAADFRGRSDIPGQLGELATLLYRAQALGPDDPKIQRLAYEDSIERLLANTTHRAVHWLAALLRPSHDTPGGLPAKAKALSRNLRRRSRS